MDDATAPTRRELARALDIVDDYVRRLAKQGMPVHSIEAARAWRAERFHSRATRADVSAPIARP